MIYIGIDTGTHTGLAIWDGDAAHFTEICELPLHAALEKVRKTYAFFSRNGKGVVVYFEDARLRKWFGKMTAERDRARLQGAGSVKRDAAIWEEALTDWAIPFVKVAPKDNLTKMNATYFKAITKWEHKTNEHQRDAAMLVFGRK